MTPKTYNANKLIVLLIGGALISVIGTIDRSTGNEVSFSIFYLIPIIYVTWFADRKSGYLFAAIGAATWYFIDSLSGTHFSSPAIPFWNAIVRLGFFGIVVYLMGELRIHRTQLEKKVEERTGDLMSEIEDHKRSKEELLQKSEMLRKLTGKIERIKEEENTKIAREIHDELGQYLTAINLEINWIKKKYSNVQDLAVRTTNISEMVNETVKTVRKISSELRPRLLDQLGVIPAIESYLKEFRKRTGIKYNLQLDTTQTSYPADVSASLYRIFQEAVTNIARHSRATIVHISISSNGNSIIKMNIKDNGVGFKSGANGESQLKTLGIIGMKERALILGGKLEIHSKLDSGTEVSLELPFNK